MEIYVNNVKLIKIAILHHFIANVLIVLVLYATLIMTVKLRFKIIPLAIMDNVLNAYTRGIVINQVLINIVIIINVQSA